MPGNDYNLYVAGPDRTGLTFIAKTYIEKVAKKAPPPSDWCYVYNFQEPDTPRFLELRRGMGLKLKEDIAGFLEEIKTEKHDVFESEGYNTETEPITKGTTTNRKDLFSQ